MDRRGVPRDVRRRRRGMRDLAAEKRPRAWCRMNLQRGSSVGPTGFEVGRNTSGRIIDAPTLAVVDGARQDIIGTVRLSVDRIGPGITIPFSGRFKLAGGKSADITIIPEHG